jgi:hypothetical protein
MAERTYSRAEMEEIFRRAAEHTQFAQGDAEAIRYEDLVAAAREVGIDPSTLEDIARNVETERHLVAQRADHEEIVKHELAERRHRARRSLLTYVIVTTFLAAIDWMTPGGPWAHWVALGWGLFVALRLGRATLEPSRSERERLIAKETKRRSKRARQEQRRRAAEEWKRRLVAQEEAIRRELAQQQERRRDRDRERRRRSLEREQASRDFELAVEDGVTQLLTALAKRVGDAARDELPSGAFGEFVRRERARAEGASMAPAARVRVEAPGRYEDAARSNEDAAPKAASASETSEPESGEDERRRERRAARR